jgi:hypothetical protein
MATSRRRGLRWGRRASDAFLGGGLPSRRPGGLASSGTTGNDDGEFVPNGRSYCPSYMASPCRSPCGAGPLSALYPPGGFPWPHL